MKNRQVFYTKWVNEVKDQHLRIRKQSGEMPEL
jgi:hypothetical protein